MSVEDLKDLIKDIIAQEMGDDEMMDDEMDNIEDEEIDLGMEDEMMEESEEINLEELLAELESLDEENGDSSDLDEAIQTINTLRSELQEVNLLNAKLLYVNKIFKAKNLTESQKVKVIASFDKATTANEAKIIFESLESTLTAVTSNVKSQIKESLGFASKAAGVAPKKQIVEINETISRMQQLAGIIK
jgi:type I site-specific restriction-modification system R (restriction) subunit